MMSRILAPRTVTITVEYLEDGRLPVVRQFEIPSGSLYFDKEPDGSRLIEIRPFKNSHGLYWHERRITPTTEQEQIMDQAADDWHPCEAAMELHCPRCSAAPGEQCVTASGNPARNSHTARTIPLITAYGSGYEEGYRDGMLRVGAK